MTHTPIRGMNTRIQQHVARAATSYLPQGTHTSTQHEVHTNTRPRHAHRFPAQHSCCNTKPHPTQPAYATRHAPARTSAEPHSGPSDKRQFHVQGTHTTDPSVQTRATVTIIAPCSAPLKFNHQTCSHRQCTPYFFLPVSTTPRRRSDTDGNNMEGTFLISASCDTEWGGCQKRTHPLRLTLELHLVYVATIYLARSYGRAKPRLSRMPQPQARLAAAHASHHFSSSQLYPNTLNDPTPLELSPRSVWITL